MEVEEIARAHGAMVGRQVMFSEVLRVVGQVVGSATPVDEALTLFDTTFNPVNPHVQSWLWTGVALQYCWKFQQCMYCWFECGLLAEDAAP